MKPVLYMAPMRGVTNCVYRNVYSRLFDGYDFAVTPFIRNCNVVSFECKTLRDILVDRNSADFELIPQILGNCADEFINMSKVMFEMGYKTVNWNLGCPYKKVRKKNRGAGLLSEPEIIVGFINKVITEIPNQISLKVRLGNENHNELFTLLLLLNDFPLKNIIIHPRTAKQMYSGEVDIAAFEKCLSLTKHRVIYNGDIDSFDSFRALSKRLHKIDTWMIGRGGVINPFLPEQIKNLSPDTGSKTRERFVEFHQELFATYQEELSGSSHIISKMKELWSYWAKAFEGGNQVLRSLAKTRNVDQYASLVDKFFNEEPKLLI